MSGEAAPLSVVPGALQSASGVISGHAASLTTAPGSAPTSMESAGQAGAAVNQALQAYRAAFSQRLYSVASGLDAKAGAYTGQEGANSQAVASLVPGTVV